MKLRPAAVVVAVLVSLILIIFMMVWMALPHAGQDVTSSRYNGFKPGQVYRLKKRMVLWSVPASEKMYDSDVIDFKSVGEANKDSDLRIGTRIRFDKTIWVSGHLGAAPVAYGTILDPPFVSRFVNLTRLSRHSRNLAEPDPALLEESP
jgi:hypothetical protein